ERIATRARVYAGKVRVREARFDTLPAYQEWREQARQVIHQAFHKPEFLLWVTGNHLGTLPIYEALGGLGPQPLVVPLDAHLGVYNLPDCTAELSHGNFLLHSAGPLPAIINVGNREQLLRPEYVRRYYRHAFPAAALALDPEPALGQVREASRKASR